MAQYLVLKHVGGRDCGIDADGTPHFRYEEAQCYDLPEAREVAARHGGTVKSEFQLFGNEDDEFGD